MKNIALAFCQRALSNSDPLSNAERADHLDFACTVLMSFDAKIGLSARELAENLRNAEASQLKFQALLSAAHN